MTFTAEDENGDYEWCQWVTVINIAFPCNAIKI